MLQPKVYVKSERKVFDKKKVFDAKEIHFDIDVVAIDDGVNFDYCELDFDEVIFMDNTGFKDKNGANIYTGNIVEYVRRHPDVGTLRGVICKNEYGAYVIELYVMKNRMDEVCETIDQMLGSKVEYEKPNLSFLLDSTTHDGCVVLGNIYEDKELLKC